MSVAEALTDPRTWGVSESAVELRETHVSWVALVGRRAYKVKKPVVMTFLDFGTLDRRRQACADEVRLNRRLAPRTYLGVRSLVPAGAGLTLADADDTLAVEYVVEMRRFDEGLTLAALLSRGTGPSTAAAGDIGRRLARFHADAPAVKRVGGAEHAKRALDDTFASLRGLTGAAGADLMARAERFTSAFLTARCGQLEDRGQSGRVREGHGDLRAEHVLLDGELEILDCVEFSLALRCVDVADDLAFLVMDLRRAERPDLADALVAGYRSAGGEPGEEELLAFFAASRARVRAKVALLRAYQLRGKARSAKLREADDLLALGDRLDWRARGRLLLVTAGPAASGKSTLARAIAERSGLPVLSSDVIRKQRDGLAPTRRGGVELYDAHHDDVTYQALIEEAAARLAADRGVIVDATFRDPRRRAAISALAHRSQARLLVIECHVPEGEAARRAAARMNAPTVSDAGPDVVHRQRQAWMEWDALEPSQHLRLRTDGAIDVQVCSVTDTLDVAEIYDRRCGR